MNDIEKLEQEFSQSISACMELAVPRPAHSRLLDIEQSLLIDQTKSSHRALWFALLLGLAGAAGALVYMNTQERQSAEHRPVIVEQPASIDIQQESNQRVYENQVMPESPVIYRQEIVTDD